jgi:hypothetical protein
VRSIDSRDDGKIVETDTKIFTRLYPGSDEMSLRTKVQTKDLASTRDPIEIKPTIEEGKTYAASEIFRRSRESDEDAV